MTRLVIFGKEKSELLRIKNEISNFLVGYRLILHPDKSRVYPVEQGVPFLGFQIFPGYKLVRAANLQRYKKRKNRYLKWYRQGKLTAREFNMRIFCWFVHASFANTYHLRKKLYIDIYGKSKEAIE